MSLVLLLACAGASTADNEAYLAILREPRPEVDRDLPRCAALADPSLAGDCALAVASRASIRDPDACDAVPAGVWREECWFQVMETRRRQGRWDEAVAACDRTGRFHDRCQYHLWEEDILRLLQGIDWQEARRKPPSGDGRPTPPRYGPQDVAAATAAAVPLYDDWTKRIPPDTRLVADDLPLGFATDDTRFEHLFWARVYVQLFEHGPPDPSACDAVARADLCRAAIRDVERRHPR